MASIRKLPSGKYQGRYRDALGDEQSAGTYTQPAQALREAGRKESEAREPGAINVSGGKIPWGTWFEQWHGSRSLAYATDECYRSTASNHVMPKWDHVRLADITTLEVNRWVKTMLQPRKSGEKPCSPWVVRNALMLFKTSMNAAVAAKRLATSAAKGVPYPDLPVGLERYLTPDEVEAITFYLDGVNALILQVGVQTGLRFGEISGLHWNRLDLKRGVIQVVEKFDQKAGVIDLLPKDNEQRTVPLPPDLVGLLARYRDYAARQPGKTCGIPHAGGGRCTGDILFRGARGAPIKSNDWGKTIWKKALDLAGIEGRVRPHDMRHTYASWLIQEGVPLPELARVMGHSDWEVTRRYAHLSDAGFDEVRAALARRTGAQDAPVEVPPVDLEDRLAALEAQLAALREFAPAVGGRATRRATESPHTPLRDAI